MKYFAFAIVLFAAASVIVAQPNEQAILKAAQELQLKGEYDSAYEEFSRILLRFPGSESTPAARYGMALASIYSEHPEEAALQFQQLINEFGDTAFAAQARRMNTIYYRLYLAPLAGAKVFAPDTSYTASVLDLDEPSGMAMDSKGNLYLSDKGKRLVYTFDPAGKLINSAQIITPYYISTTPKDEVWVASNTGILSLGKPALTLMGPNAEPLEEVRSVAVNDSGTFFVVSNKTPGILIYDAEGKSISTPALPRLPFAKVVVSPRRQIYALPKERKTISIFNENGSPLTTIQSDGKELVIAKIDDFTVDLANHVYVLTDDPRGVLIFSPSGKLKKWLPSAKNTAMDFEDSKFLAVGPDGAIYLMNKKDKRVIKLS